MAVNLADLSLPQLEGLKNQLEQVIEKCHCNLVPLFGTCVSEGRQFNEPVC